MTSGVRDGVVLLCLALVGGIFGLMAGGDMRETAYGVSAILAVIGLGLVVLALVRPSRT